MKIAAHPLNKRGGVLIGDVVGLGETLIAAVAHIFEDDHDLETLIICLKNLMPMWEDYRTRYASPQGAVAESGDDGTAQATALSPGAHRRKPQPAQPRGQALPGHPGVHQRNESKVIAFRCTIQQDLP